jgi:hypothetical protein
LPFDTAAAPPAQDEVEAEQSAHTQLQRAIAPHSGAGPAFSATDRFMIGTKKATTNVNIAAIQKVSK